MRRIRIGRTDWEEKGQMEYKLSLSTLESYMDQFEDEWGIKRYYCYATRSS